MGDREGSLLGISTMPWSKFMKRPSAVSPRSPRPADVSLSAKMKYSFKNPRRVPMLGYVSECGGHGGPSRDRGKLRETPVSRRHGPFTPPCVASTITSHFSPRQRLLFSQLFYPLPPSPIGASLQWGVSYKNRPGGRSQLEFFG